MMRKKENKTKKVFNFKSVKIYVLGDTCGLMAIACIFMTISSAASGGEIASLQSKEAELTAQQQQLQESLVTTLSVNSLQEQSSALGFTKVGNLVYVGNTASLTGSKPVAKLP